MKACWTTSLVLAVLMALDAGAEQFEVVDPAAWTRFGVDAAGEALGRAATVDPRGATAFWWNPAPLPDDERAEASYTAFDYPLDDITVRPLALRGSRDNLTAGIVWNRLHMDGEAVEIDRHLVQIGAACDVMPWLAEGTSRWIWTVGGNLRHVRERFVDSLNDHDGSAFDVDLGTSIAWTQRRSATLTVRWHATAMVRNLLRGDVERSPATTYALPRYYHAGLGIEAGVGERRRGRHLVAARVSLVLRRDLEDLRIASYDSDHVGCEVTVGGLVSLRAGYRSDGQLTGAGWSWGAGVAHRWPRWQGFGLALDYASIETSLRDGETLDHWTVTAGLDLPR